MKRALILFSLLIGIAGCGDLAPTDAQIEGPVDVTATVAFQDADSSLIFHPLEFVFKNAAADVLADIEVEFFRSGTIGNIFIIDEAGNELAASIGSVKIKTDERGTARIGLRMVVPGCGGFTVPVSTSGGIFATVKSASFQWTLTATRACVAPTP